MAVAVADRAILALLPSADRRRINSSAALMESDNDGEALAALRATRRLLAPHGVGPADVFRAALDDVVAPLKPFSSRRSPHAPDERPFEAKVMRQHERLARHCLAFPDRLTPWERKFLASIATERTLSSRQSDRLQAIARTVEMKGWSA